MADYDWSDNPDDLVFSSRAAVAVYLNGDGNLVIRQQCDCYEDEDSVVIVPRDMVSELVRKISTAVDLKQSPPRLVKD